VTFADIVGVVPFEVELTTATRQPVAAVFDPGDQGNVGVLDRCHRPRVHDRRDLDQREVDDAHAFAALDTLVADVEAGVNHDASLVVRLLVPGNRHAWLRARRVDVAEHFGEELAEHR
jgi:hypothetical protein